MSVSFDWGTEKNHRLIQHRGISFESIVSATEKSGLLDVPKHPNQDRYPRQMIYVVKVDEYIHFVPYVTQADGTRFLKTIIPSRKATRAHRRRHPS